MVLLLVYGISITSQPSIKRIIDEYEANQDSYNNIQLIDYNDGLFVSIGDKYEVSKDHKIDIPMSTSHFISDDYFQIYNLLSKSGFSSEAMGSPHLSVIVSN
jgi:hypothetical protein